MKKTSDTEKKTANVIAQLGHEMREPLHAMMGYAEILMEETVGELNPKQQRYLKIIYEGAEALVNLADEFLDYSRLSHVQEPVKGEVVAPMVVLKNLEASFRLKAKEKNLIFQVEEGKENILFTSDKNRIRRALQALIDNAIKYTPEGGSVTIACGYDDDSFSFSVRDTGSGIAPAELEAIFMPFYRGGSRAVVKGAGLGLTMASKLARDIGGTIKVSSTPGEGSVFSLIIPPNRDVSFPSDKLDERFIPQVLLMCDEEHAKLYADSLELEGYSFKLISPEKLIKSIRRWHPLAVMVDTSLFDEANTSLRELILTDPLGRHTPFLVSCSDCSPLDPLLIKRVSANDLLLSLDKSDVCHQILSNEDNHLGESLRLIAQIRWEEEKVAERQGFYGYTHLLGQMSREISRARREKTEATVVIISLIGLPMKPEILSLIYQHTRYHDFLCPLNEYAAVFLPNTGEHSAEILGARLKEQALEKYKVELEYVHATFPHQAKSTEKLLSIVWDKILKNEIQVEDGNQSTEYALS